MSKKESLGRPNTAKRKIQIRHYIEEQRQQQSRSFSNPFLDEEVSGDEPEIPIRHARFDFQSSLVGEEEESSVDPSDDILSSNVNLDEADRFISSLKLPRSRKIAEDSPKVSLPKPISSIELNTFKAESERLDSLRRKEAEDPSESDESLI